MLNKYSMLVLHILAKLSKSFLGYSKCQVIYLKTRVIRENFFNCPSSSLIIQFSNSYLATRNVTSCF